MSAVTDRFVTDPSSATGFHRRERPSFSGGAAVAAKTRSFRRGGGALEASGADETGGAQHTRTIHHGERRVAARRRSARGGGAAIMPMVHGRAKRRDLRSELNLVELVLIDAPPPMRARLLLLACALSRASGLVVGGRCPAPAPAVAPVGRADAPMMAAGPARWRKLLRPSTAAAAALAAVLAGPVVGPLGGGSKSEAVAAAMPMLGKRMNAKALEGVLKKKLKRVPVFMVTNDGGSPFLSSTPDGNQAALMFMFPADAQAMLKGVLRAPNGASSGARILATDFERAFDLACLAPAESGLQDPTTGRDLTMVWQFQPHSAEQRAAQALLVQSMKAPTVPKCPAYTVDGLVYSKGGKQVRPVFLAKRDLDAALKKAEASGVAPASKSVVVLDLLELVNELAIGLKGGNEDAAALVQSIEFVPPSESVSLRDEIKPAPSKARIIPPDHSRRQ